jgi:hypothetical protein
MYWQVIKKKNYKDIFSLITDSQTSNVYKESTLVGNQRIILNYINTVYKPNYYFNPNDFVVGRALFNNTVYINEFYQSLITYLVDVYSKYIYSLPLVSSTVLYLNSTVLIGEDSNFFNYAVPYSYYNSTPLNGIYTYSFALNPTETQPSGTINLSRIPNFQIRVKLNEIAIKYIKNHLQIDINENINNIYNDSVNNDVGLKLIVQVTNFNVLRIIGGISATAYSY